MAQEQVALRRIEWPDVFAFTRLFGGFRSALHSTKIVLALGGLLLTFFVGFAMDWIWVSAGQGVWPREVQAFALVAGDLDREHIARQATATLAAKLTDLRITTTPQEGMRRAQGNPCQAARDIRAQIRAQYTQAVDETTRQAETAKADAERLTDPAQRERMLAQTRDNQAGGYAAAMANMKMQSADLRRVAPIGPFHALIRNEAAWLSSLVRSAATLRFMEGLDVLAERRGPAGELSPQMEMALERPGVFAAMGLMALGLFWLLKEHWLYAVFFVPICLAIWSIAGGGICRAAVLEFAKGEKIGLKQAVRFALSKFWGFFFAPVVCLAFVLVIGLMILAGAFVGSAPVLDILIGILWFLAILGGLAIAFITIGTLAGGSLFAPVVAAEGSDMFDAISRGFVYVYSRPWKALLYGLVLVIYGSLCYLFLRFFVWLLLAAVHVFTSAGMLNATPAAGPRMDKLSLVWQMPGFFDLRPHPLDWSLLAWNQAVLAFLIGLWTYLVWSLLQSWLISFYFTGSSMAYLLLRREVDAIDHEEIYMKEEPEAAPAEVPAPPAEGAPVEAAAPAGSATIPPATGSQAPAPPPPPSAPPPPPGDTTDQT